MKLRVIDRPDEDERPAILNNDDADDLPEGWMSTTIGLASDLNPHKPPISALPPGSSVSFVPMPSVDARLGSIVSADERPYSEVRGGYTVFADGDVILAKITPCSENGKAAIARNLKNGLAAGSTEFHVLRPNGAAIPKYLFHFVRQPSFRGLAENHMTGTAGQRRVPASFMELAPLPLPPLAEQLRITDAVEALLARVEAGRARLDRVPAILKRFRQAVLAAACSGRLTEDWRNNNSEVELAAATIASTRARIRRRYEQALEFEPAVGARRPSRPKVLSAEALEVDGLPVLPHAWVWTSFDHVAEDITVGHVGPMAGEYVANGIPFLRSLNVREFLINPADLKFISPGFHARLAKSALRPGDVAIVRTGNPGVACVIPPTLKVANCSDLVILRPSEVLNAAYATVFLNSREARSHVEDVKVGIAQGHFNIGSMRTTPLPLPPLEEQAEIVRRVEALFALADAIERRVATARKSADALPQAIVARAFSGRLVPTEAELARREGRTYEPASVLLERIRRDRASQPAAKKTRGRGPG